MSLAEIQEAIEKLGPEERAELWTWFQEAEVLRKSKRKCSRGLRSSPD